MTLKWSNPNLPGTPANIAYEALCKQDMTFEELLEAMPGITEGYLGRVIRELVTAKLIQLVRRIGPRGVYSVHAPLHESHVITYKRHIKMTEASWIPDGSMPNKVYEELLYGGPRNLENLFPIFEDNGKLQGTIYRLMRYGTVIGRPHQVHRHELTYCVNHKKRHEHHVQEYYLHQRRRQMNVPAPLTEEEELERDFRPTSRQEKPGYVAPSIFTWAAQVGGDQPSAV